MLDSLITSDYIRSKPEKISRLQQEQKRINQITVRLNCCYNGNMPPLKEQITGWINKEIKLLQVGLTHNATANIDNDAENKIRTSLSVAKPAVLIRLLEVDKIIINRQVAPMLLLVSKILSTLQKMKFLLVV